MNDDGMPRWVKVSGLIALVLLVLGAVIALSGGNHGPQRHFGSPVFSAETP